MTTFTLPRLSTTEPDSEPAGGIGILWHPRGNLPLERLTYDATVRGLACETVVTQRFFNPFDECLEVTYTFPLPGQHAVVRCQMQVGERTIEADLQERGAARQAYRQAIQQGHRAALLEEERSETFNLRVGNIPPGETIDVRLTLVGELPVMAGEATLRLPLVVAPRYVPGRPLDGKSVGDGVGVDTAQVPDASRVTPPTLLPGFPNPIELAIHVRIDPGALVARDDWWREMRSSLHAVNVSESRACDVQLAWHERVDRDFILRFDLAGEAVRSSLLLNASAGQRGTFAVHLVPPRQIDTPRRPRDIVFLLDHSDSMEGWKLAAACRGTGRMIDKLSAADRFQVILFDDHVKSLAFPESEWVAASDQNRWRAVQAVAQVRSGGGTEMGPALRLALRQFSGRQEHGLHTPAIVLITDGQVAGEDAILSAWAKCEPSRQPWIYCLGIDQAVNASVLQRLSNRTGGLCELVESERRLDEVLERFSQELGGHVLDKIQLRADEGRIEEETTVPRHRLTLYADRPLTLYGRTRSGGEALSLTITGERSDGSAWEQTLTATASPAAILPLWGRQRVRELEDDYVCGGSTNRRLREEIVSCSLDARVLSRFTAYVAIDRSECVNESGTVAQIVQPVELPAGWDGEPSAGAAAPVRQMKMRSRGPVPMAPPPASVAPTVIEQVPESVARENLVIPVREDGNALVVRMANPNDVETLEKLRFILNRPIVAEHAPPELILDAINAGYGQDEGESADSKLQEFTDTAIDFTETSSDDQELTSASVPIHRLVHLMIADATQLRTSHIFIEPHVDLTAVHYVIDGNCVPRETLPRQLHEAIVNRWKELGNVDRAPSDRLQSGSFTVTVGDEDFELQVYFIPGDDGESILARIARAAGQTQMPSRTPTKWMQRQQRENRDRHDPTIVPRLLERAERCAAGTDQGQQLILARLRTVVTPTI